jgi:hypothetical protein
LESYLCAFLIFVNDEGTDIRVWGGPAYPDNFFHLDDYYGRRGESFSSFLISRYTNDKFDYAYGSAGIEPTIFLRPEDQVQFINSFLKDSIRVDTIAVRDDIAHVLPKREFAFYSTFTRPITRSSNGKIIATEMLRRYSYKNWHYCSDCQPKPEIYHFDYIDNNSLYILYYEHNTKCAKDTDVFVYEYYQVLKPRPQRRADASKLQGIIGYLRQNKNKILPYVKFNCSDEITGRVIRDKRPKNRAEQGLSVAGDSVFNGKFGTMRLL